MAMAATPMMRSGYVGDLVRGGTAEHRARDDTTIAATQLAQPRRHNNPHGTHIDISETPTSEGHGTSACNIAGAGPEHPGCNRRPASYRVKHRQVSHHLASHASQN